MSKLFVRACVALLLMVLAIVGVWLGQLIGNDPGYVMFALNGVSVETSVWFFLAMLMAIAGLVSVLLWFIHGVFNSKNRFSQWLQHRAHQTATQKTNSGLMELMAGLWKDAEKDLLKSAPASDAPILNYVAAARAAEQLGDTKTCDEALLKAEELSAHSFVVLLTRADIQLKRGQLDVACYELEQLYQRHPKNDAVLTLLQKAYYQKKQWTKLNQLLPAIRKHNIVPAEAFALLESDVAQQLLMSAAHNDSRDGDALKMLDDIWRGLSSTQIRDVQVIAAYAQALMHLHADHDAEVILKNTLKKQWNEPCVRLVAQINGGDVAKRLQTAEGWLRDHPHDPVLLLTLGRLCLRNQLWGKARTYFQESLHLAHTTETYAELGRLCAALSEHELSTGYFRQGLLLAQPLPDLPLPLIDNQKISLHLR